MCFPVEWYQECYTCTDNLVLRDVLSLRLKESMEIAPN